MKCKICKNEKVRILGKNYCPSCSKKTFDFKKHIGNTLMQDQSFKAILWGVAISFSSTLLIIAILRFFFVSSEIPNFIILILGFICFGSAGFVTKYFDSEYYLSDNFLISLIFSLIVSAVDWYFGSAAYAITFFSSLLVFFISISVGSFLSLYFINREE